MEICLLFVISPARKILFFFLIVHSISSIFQQSVRARQVLPLSLSEMLFPLFCVHTRSGSTLHLYQVFSLLLFQSNRPQNIRRAMELPANPFGKCANLFFRGYFTPNLLQLFSIFKYKNIFYCRIELVRNI